MNDFWRAVVVLALVLGNAFFVAAEYSIITARRTRLEDRAEDGHRRARTALRLMDEPVRFISTVQVGITVLGIALGVVGEPLVSRYFDFLPRGVAFVVSFAVLTYLSVVLGELVPKAVALQHPRTVALLLSRPLLFLFCVVVPVIALFNGVTRLVLRLVGVREGAPASRAHSTRELATLIDETRRAGALKPEQAEVLLNVFRLSGKTARDVMVPLERAGMIDLRWPAERVLESVIACAHTRMPVFDGDRARVVGLVNAKDVFRAFRTTGTVDLTQVMRPIAFVPAEARVEEQLQRFRARRLHMAIVRAGEAPVGLVTLEDLIEEVVGDIEDEHDPVAHTTPRAC